MNDNKPERLSAVQVAQPQSAGSKSSQASHRHAGSSVKPNKKKYERYKLAAIPILVGVLAYVVFGPTQTAEEIGLTPPATTQLTDGLQAGSLQATSSSSTVVASHHPWPEVDLQFLSQANPLASQWPLPEPATTQQFTSATGEASTTPSDTDHLQDVVRDLSGSPLKYVFRSDHRRLVMLGDQIFEKGDQLSETVQLHDVHTHALILRRHEPDRGQRPLSPVID